MHRVQTAALVAIVERKLSALQRQKTQKNTDQMRITAERTCS
jgi:hypothetical protein